MTAARLFSLFVSLPFAAQFALVLALTMVGFGIWATSQAAERAASRAADRRERRRTMSRRDAHQRDRHLRAVRRAPQEWIDHELRGREIQFAGELDLSGGDLEEADR